MNETEAIDEAMEPVDTDCQICGGKVRVYVPASVLKETATPLAGAFSALLRMAAHGTCQDKRVSEYRKKERAAQIAYQIEMRNKYWEGICPPEFRTPLDWLNRTCRRNNFENVMHWNFGKIGLIVTGPTGRCKTRFVYQLLHQQHEAGRSIIALRHQQFRQTISRLASDNQVELGAFMAKLVRVDILFLDDLGKGTITPASEEALSEVIDHRGSNERPVFYTSNDTVETLKGRLSPDRGGPLIRRILDNCQHIAFD